MRQKVIARTKTAKFSAQMDRRVARIISGATKSKRIQEYLKINEANSNLGKF
jgi:hypothetical protein